MNRTRALFIVLILLAIAAVVAAGVLRYGSFQNMLQAIQTGQIASAPRIQLATPATTAAATGQPANKLRLTATAVAGQAADQPTVAAPVEVTTAPAANAPAQPTGFLAPIWGPNYKENDGLGNIICGAYAFSADYPLQQIQMSGLDIKNGFHLGIVPFYLNENYIVSAKDRADALESGKLDCLLTTFDLMALEDPGVLTAFINESAGADQIWARGINSLNELRGKRIAFEANGPSAYFVYDLLSTVQLTPQDVTLLPQQDQNTSIEVFNKNEADVVAGWEPVIFAAEKSGGKPLVTTKDFRSILGGIVISRKAMQEKRTVIQLFHNAWFEAVAQWETDFPTSAQQIAAWGHNDYLGVSKENAAADLTKLLGGVAEASLADNVRAFSNVSSVVARVLTARKLWASVGNKVPTSDVTTVINPEFVQNVAKSVQVDPEAVSKFVNNTFSLGRTKLPVQNPAGTASDPAAAPTADAIANSTVIATLPCSRFEFVPNSAQLQQASQQQLRDCAVRVLQQNITLYVKVKGSSAWPGPKGTFTQAQVETTARGRAQSIVDYLVSQGINKDRFVVEWTLPPEDHRETTDVVKQSQDRYVELTLLVAGL